MTTRYYRLHAHKVRGSKRDHLSLDGRTGLCNSTLQHFRTSQTADERQTLRESIAERGFWPLCTNCIMFARRMEEGANDATAAECDNSVS